MKYEDRLYSPTGSRTEFYILYGLFALNNITFNFQWLESFLWDFLKTELFYFDGHCLKCAYCCQKLMLYQHEKPINSDSLLAKANAKSSTYSRFSISERNKDASIRYFSCSALSDTLLCQDYANRPHFCKKYPLSNFFMNHTLYQKCGYTIKRTNLNLKIKNKRLQALIQIF